MCDETQKIKYKYILIYKFIANMKYLKKNFLITIFILNKISNFINILKLF